MYDEDGAENNLCDEPDAGRPIIDILHDEDDGIESPEDLTEETVEQAAEWMPVFEVEEV